VKDQRQSEVGARMDKQESKIKAKTRIEVKGAYRNLKIGWGGSQIAIVEKNREKV